MSLNLIALLFLSVILSGCSVSTPKQTSQEKLLLDSADSKSIIKFYKKNLSKNTEYKAKLVNQYLDVNDVKSAQLYANTYSGDDFNNPLFLFTLSRISIANKKYGKAEEQIEKFLTVGGDKLKYHLLVAKIFALQGKFVKAELNFLEAKKLGASDSRIANDLAVIKMMQRKYSDAVELLYKIYLDDPSNKKIRANLLLSAAHSGLEDIALKVLEHGNSEALAKKQLEMLMATIRERNENRKIVNQSQSIIDRASFSDKSNNVGKNRNATNSNESLKKNEGVGGNETYYGKGATRIKSKVQKPSYVGRRTIEPVAVKEKVSKIFRVQILATYHPLESEYINYLKGEYGSVYEYESNSVIRYCLGSFRSISEAKSFLKRIDFSDAFVVSYGLMEHKVL